MVDAAEVVVSELVTNALLHAATAVEVSAYVDGSGLSLEVADGSTSMPSERDHAALAGVAIRSQGERDLPAAEGTPTTVVLRNVPLLMHLAWHGRRRARRHPPATVADFSTLNRVMDAALALAEVDRMLAAPIRPELRELRRWLCGQVLTLSAGADPSMGLPSAPAGARRRRP